VENFVYNLLTTIFNAEDTATFVMEDIMTTASFDPGPQARRMEEPSQWTPDKIKEKASLIESDKGPDGDFDD
jgi:hypothetical protein